MPTSGTGNWPYPSASVVPDVPADIKALADRAAALVDPLILMALVNVADLNALAAISATAEGRRIHVDELNCDFQAQDGVWVQVGTAGPFVDAVARDNAYAKASGVFRAERAQALLANGRLTEWHTTARATTAGWFGVSSTTIRARTTAANITTGGGAIDFATAQETPADPDFSYAAGVFTALRAGRYAIDVHVSLANVATTVALRLTKGTTIIADLAMIGNASAGISGVMHRELVLVAGDTFRLNAVSGVTIALFVPAAPNEASANFISVRYLGQV